MNYRQEYEKWLASPALSEDERNELKAIANDEKEIENRFYGPLEFGTAGLRGTMYVGLHNMNRHVIRWATQGFANVICAEGEEAIKKGHRHLHGLPQPLNGVCARRGLRHGGQRHHRQAL